MKIKSVLMMLSAASIMMACDKEENGSKTVDFAGSYNGYTLASCNYFQNMISAGRNRRHHEKYGRLRLRIVHLRHVG